MRRVRPELGLDALVGLVGWQHSLAGPELDAPVHTHTHTHVHEQVCETRHATGIEGQAVLQGDSDVGNARYIFGKSGTRSKEFGSGKKGLSQVKVA